MINFSSATDTVTASGTLVTTYPAHTSTNGIEEGVIRLTWTNDLAASAHTSAVRLPEGNTVITEVIAIVTTGAATTVDFGLVGTPNGILDGLDVSTAGIQSAYDDTIAGGYAADTGNGQSRHWIVPDSVTGGTPDNRRFRLTPGNTGSAGTIIVKYINYVA